MSAFWRQVGLNYINYSQICARVLRQALKEPFKTSSAGRDESLVKTARWEGGKVVKTDISPSQMYMVSEENIFQAGKYATTITAELIQECLDNMDFQQWACRTEDNESVDRLAQEVYSGTAKSPTWS